jgi:hypothetical protein
MYSRITIDITERTPQPRDRTKGPPGAFDNGDLYVYYGNSLESRNIIQRILNVPIDSPMPPTDSMEWWMNRSVRYDCSPNPSGLPLLEDVEPGVRGTNSVGTEEEEAPLVQQARPHVWTWVEKKTRAWIEWTFFGG